ncbi:MAG TPA: GNAT family N-acetyltransferase [Candidatus Acidoferrales bacterium]|nr:GNAT family N-acetyltransferase [Candidatus Acidoferrales bacterium]
MDPLIRPAKKEDADFLAWAILAAGRSHLQEGWFDIILGRAEADCLDYLRRLTLTPSRSWWHYSRFLVAEADGAPVAALSAFRARDAYPLSQQAMTETAQELGWGAPELQAMWQRGAYIFTCMLETDDNVWAIENIATLPTHRGRGLAGLLLERAVLEGKRNGARQAQITFLIGNDAAERAYAKAGFTLKDEKRNPDFAAATSAPGLRRYMRDL